jgi:hypothetical protein
MPPRFREAPLSFNNDCTNGRSLERILEEPLISALENGLDFFGLRLLTPLRPILFSLSFEIIELRIDQASARMRFTLLAIRHSCQTIV